MLKVLLLTSVFTIFVSELAFADCETIKACGSCNSGAFEVRCKCVSSNAPPGVTFSCECNDGGTCSVRGYCRRTTMPNNNGTIVTTTDTSYVGCGSPCPPNVRLRSPGLRPVNAFVAQNISSGLEVSQVGRRIEFRTSGFLLDVLDPVADVEPRKVSNLRVSFRNLGVEPITGLIIRWSFEDTDGTTMELLAKVDSLLGRDDIQPNIYRAIENTQEIRSKKSIQSILGEVVYLEYSSGITAGNAKFASYFESSRKRSADLTKKLADSLSGGTVENALGRILNLLDSTEFSGSEVKLLAKELLQQNGISGIEQMVKSSRLTGRY